MDTGAGSSYISGELARRIGKTPIRRETKTVDMMLHSTTRKIETYELKVGNMEGTFAFRMEASKVERYELLTLPNPRYQEIISKHQHLRGVKINDVDEKDELPVHVILGAGAFCNIKLAEKPRIGNAFEPIAENTKLGWIIMSPGSENGSHLLHTRTSSTDYDDLCKLDVLGLEDKLTESQTFVHREFREQLISKSEEYYETKLMWKVNHPPLYNNRSMSMVRLKSLLKRLQQNPELFAMYDKVMQDQLSEGIIEKVDKTISVGKREFYMPHGEVVRGDAESTKLRIVFDASSRPNKDSPSLNDCLEPGPPLQNLLWNVLSRNRFKPIALCGDIKQAFLQIRINEEDRDALRFLWINSQHPEEIEEFRFTRVVFGLVQSPFILGATLEKLLEGENRDLEIVDEIKQGLYVDDLIIGGDTKDTVLEYKEKAIEIFREGGFELHKWHSNLADLETVGTDDLTYAKIHLGTSRKQTKILGLLWEKDKDKLLVNLKKSNQEACTKRVILKTLASNFDPLGIVSPVLLTGKLIFRKVCESGASWDQELPKSIEKQWRDWENALQDTVEIPRAFGMSWGQIQYIDLHVFSDASIDGTCAVVYAVVHQDEGSHQGIVASKSRISRQGLTIPRLELVGAHMATNLVDNIVTAIRGVRIDKIYGWCDSTTVLHWILGNGTYKQFVNNRVNKMKTKVNIDWKYVRTDMNPADIGSRGCKGNKLPTEWIEGPDWLSDESKWPLQIEIKSSPDSEGEAKVIKEVLKLSVDSSDDFKDLLNKLSLWKFLRVMSWVNRFIQNCRNQNIRGPLTSDETMRQRKFWIRRAQEEVEGENTFIRDCQRLNLVKNKDNLLECRGRIQGEFPIYVPTKTLLSQKLVENSHKRTLHGGVLLTMADIRSELWIPKLRQLSKGVISNCNGCKRFHTINFTVPRPGLLPLERTQGTRAFQVIGTDFAGPLTYRYKNNCKKCYILLFSCSLIRAVHLVLLPNQTTEEFIKALKGFVARRARPEVMYSDNAKSFIAAKKWIKRVSEDDKLNEYLGQQTISWRFNLSRAPWWGGQFERLIGMVKGCLYKTVGNSLLYWSELEEVLLDVETTLNNRPLTYLEEDIQYPVLTPNIMIHGIPVKMLEEDISDVEGKDLKKRLKYIKRCKDAVWLRWTREYLRSLRERHDMVTKTKQRVPQVGEVVIIKGDERNRGNGKLVL